MKTNILLTATFLLLTACGFTPMYGDIGGKGYGNEDLMALVHINTIPDREGQMLHNQLIDRLTPKGYAQNPQYKLEISKLDESLRDLDITKDSDSTRGQLRLQTQMVLRDSVTDEKLITRNLHAITSYNILGSEFASRVTEQNARENAITELANQIELQLGLYFKKM